jgi:hypothetical protein
MENEGLELGPDDIGALGGADANLPGSAEAAPPTHQAQAIRNLQRARKSLTSDGNATGLTDHLTQAATVWAILELADAVRSTRQLP